MSTRGQGTLLDRMVRAAKVEPSLYDEVEHDESATSQALIVVIIATVASAVGAALSAGVTPMTPGGPQLNPVGVFIQTLISTPIMWVVWSYIIYFVGTRMFGGTATPGEMLRVIGFAFTPQILGLLSFIPVIGWLVSIVVFVWSLWAGIVAVRQGLDVDTGRAVVTVIVGAIAALVATLVVGLLVGLVLAIFV